MWSSQAEKTDLSMENGTLRVLFTKIVVIVKNSSMSTPIQQVTC